MKIQFLSLAGIDLPTSTIPLFADHCVAGFPSPAQDYIEQSLDLNDYCVPHPVSTFYLIAQGESMVQAGILSGDLLVVDKSLQAEHGDIVIAALDGEFTVKQLCTRPTLCLMPMNPAYSPIYVEPDQLEIFGVVTYAIHRTK
ncbi:translesion error-prone DNA polymerase V autoproteolytic subunit (plasmid) [Yersinia ruckeri]|uniref:translesion error-prone DNA polymerase V autoproteolytic subunit n=1 Tax=Yersinia TaxID=629 RepID=UPI002263EBC6|nr:translesion error-prone DNA polymerase V autoproteolytic subunit [Yersinia ruckeri]UZX63612.1 translesion error-prone DNA polymerase V autoproteolytic subunit [Yersinia ruckeri]HDM8093548.1 translesion error-prone DNA polymerase V autoproteolytic subunit [Yersinia enterocolitica]